jgi:thiol-disulfide isomerase/thioredoxin
MALVVVCALGAAVALSGQAGAEKEDAAVTVGKVMPSFTMPDYNGTEYNLKALKGKTVVLAFTSQECPYSRAADPRLAKLAEAYRPKGIVFLSIDSHKSTQPAAIKQYAHEKNETEEKLPYPILKDWQNRYADKVGAKRTPEIYIVDKGGKLVYHGALDNQKKPDDEAYVSYVGKALDEILAGKPVSEAKTSAYGCTIKRVAKAAAAPAALSRRAGS